MTRNSPSVTRALAFVLLLLSPGCGPEEGVGGWGGTIETLPNGVVRVVNPPDGLWSEETQWRLVEELALGKVEGEPSEVFGAIIGLEADADGRIYVLDRQVNEIRIFSPEGVHHRTVGRTGGGPGEYQNANGLEWIHPDSLLVIDQRGNRYSILTRDGEFVRSVPRKLGFYGWAFRGGVTEEGVSELFSVRDGEDRFPALLTTPLRNQDPVQAPDSASGGVDPTSDPSIRVDTTMLPRPDAPAFESFSVRNERGGMTMGVPFAPNAVYHLDASGRVWHGHGSDFTVYRSALEGDTTMEIVLDADPSPVSPSELAEWEAQPFVQQFREMGGDLDMDRIPGHKPFFDELYLDGDGFLWISVPGGPSETVFALLDPEGRFLGRIDLPGIERDVQVGPVVQDGKLYLVGRDALDVQHVHVFRIEKGRGED